MNRNPLLLISRKDLIEASRGDAGERMIRTPANLTRQGFHFVATASQPDDWSRSKAVSKRSRPGPKRLRERMAEAGGVLDGVYYIPQSLLTQRTRREEAIRDILDRFGTPGENCYLASSNRKLLATAAKFGVNTLKIDEKQRLQDHLDALQAALD